MARRAASPDGEPLEGGALFAHPLAKAVVATVAERGYEAASAEEIARRAGVSQAEFNAHFSGKAEAVLRVFDAYVEDFKTRTAHAYRSIKEPWPANLRAAAYELVAWIHDHPEAYHFGMVDILAGPEMARVRREELFLWCAELIDRGRVLAPDPAAVPDGAALMAVGAVAEILTRHSAGTLEGDLVEIVPQLMYGAVRPYLGDEAARAELAIPAPQRLRG